MRYLGGGLGHFKVQEEMPIRPETDGLPDENKEDLRERPEEPFNDEDDVIDVDALGEAGRIVVDEISDDEEEDEGDEDGEDSNDDEDEDDGEDMDSTDFASL